MNGPDQVRIADPRKGAAALGRQRVEFRGIVAQEGSGICRSSVEVELAIRFGGNFGIEIRNFGSQALYIKIGRAIGSHDRFLSMTC